MKASLIILIALSIILSSIPDKKEATYSECHAIYEDHTFFGVTTKTAAIECNNQPGCYVVVDNPGNFLPQDIGACTDKFFGFATYMADCTSGGETGNYVTGGSSACQSGSAIESGKLCGDTVYRCSAPVPGATCVNDVEQGFADFYDSLFKENTQTCKSKYRIVLFGGGLLAVVLVLAVI